MESELFVVLRVVLAGVFGGVIGLEREARSRPAGLRTHVLVACAAAVFVSLGDVMMQRGEGGGAVALRSDPLRILEAVVTGVSFIGAGTILFRRGKDRLEGITTAGSILVTAAIGIATALSQYWTAGLVTVFVFAVLHGLSRLDEALENRR